MGIQKKLSSKPTKRPVRIIIIVVAVIVSLIVGGLILSKLATDTSRNKFIALDSQIYKLFQNIKLYSNGTEGWGYDKSCIAELAGDWPTGQFYCSAIISLATTSTSIDELISLQSQYFPVIDKTEYLLPTSELLPQPPRDFGVNFVVSSAEKNYQESKSGTNCIYLIKLSQSTNDNYLTSDAYGSQINNGVGIINISLKCTGLASGDWYSESEYN